MAEALHPAGISQELAMLALGGRILTKVLMLFVTPLRQSTLAQLGLPIAAEALGFEPRNRKTGQV